MICHVLTAHELIGQFVHAGHEGYVLYSDGMDDRLVDGTEVSGRGALDVFNVNLEKRRELGPQSHTDAVLVEVEHWNLVVYLHEALELLVQLDAEQESVDVQTTG